MNGTRTMLMAGCIAVLLLGVAGPAAAEGDLARGETLFELCSTCHGAAGEGNPEIEAPSIAGLPEYYIYAQLRKFQGGIRGADPDDLAGLRMRPMSRWLKTDEDMQAAAAYVASLPAPLNKPTLTGDATRGAKLYAPCTACHGPDGAGNVALKAPPIANLDDWYAMAQLKKYKAGDRGANPQDTEGALMRPMSMTLVDDQAILDVLAYIQTFAK